MRPTSFCMEMKSFMRAGVTLRIAWGTMIIRRVCPWVRPRERAA